MHIIDIKTSYQGDIRFLIEKIEYLCQFPEIRQYFENATNTIEEVFSEKIINLLNFQKNDDSVYCGSNIHPLITSSIIINQKDDPRFYNQIRKLKTDPLKKERVLNWLEAFDNDKVEIC